MGLKNTNANGVETLSIKHITAKCTVPKNVPPMLKKNKTDTKNPVMMNSDRELYREDLLMKDRKRIF